MSPAGNHRPLIALGEFRLDRDDERLWSPAGHVRLGNKAFLVLSHLIDAGGQLVTKDALFSSVWDGTIVSEAALTSVVKELRRALGDDSRQPRFIQSVYGRGYRLLEPVLEVDSDRDSPAQPRRPSASAPEPHELLQALPPLLYVPAFDDGGIGSAHPWLSEVLREELLLALSRFRDFRLVSDPGPERRPFRSPSFGERDYQLTVRLLDVGPTISTFARIVRLESQEIIWAERQRLDPSGPGSGIELLIRKILAAALPRVDDDLAHRLKVRTNDAYGLYLQNKMTMRASDTLTEMQAVARSWEDFLERHPDFARAYGPLVYLYNTDYGYTGLGATTGVQRGRAYELARKAIRIDPAEPYLHTVIAWCHLWAGETIAARDHLLQAIELNPFHGDRLLEVATAWMFLGDLGQAAELLARCESLAPFAAEIPHEETALLHLLNGEYERALDCLRRVSRRTMSSELYGLLAAGACGAGDFAERVALWSLEARRRWQGSDSPDAAVLSRWALYHHPFQEPARQQWVLTILEPALTAVPATRGRTLEQALPAGSSGPWAAGMA